MLCFQWSDFSFSRLFISCHIKLLYFISAPIFQFHNFLFSKDVPLSVISLIIQNIHILKFWNIYINSRFCWWSFLALDFGIHQSFEWKDSLWQKNGNICLSFFSKVDSFLPQSLASSRWKWLWLLIPHGTYLVSLIAKLLGATTYLEYKIQEAQGFLHSYYLAVWVHEEIYPALDKEAQLCLCGFLFLYFTYHCYVFGAKAVSWNKLNVPSWLGIYIIP